jgi:oligoribonuclease
VNDRLVWIDCEMTGLDLTRDALVEVAVLVTDSELRILDDGFDILISPPGDALESMLPVVREMHTASGLLTALESTTTSLAEATEQVLAYVRSHVPERRTAPLCGNSIGTDRAFLARDIPELDDHLHYRVIDVSSIKELCRRWYPKVYHAAPPKTGGHRALADIADSVAELSYYRSTVFVPQPGPDTTAARAAAHAAPAPLTSTAMPD